MRMRSVRFTRRRKDLKRLWLVWISSNSTTVTPVLVMKSRRASTVVSLWKRLTNLLIVRSAPLTETRPSLTFLPIILLGRDESRDIFLINLWTVLARSFCYFFNCFAYLLRAILVHFVDNWFITVLSLYCHVLIAMYFYWPEVIHLIADFIHVLPLSLQKNWWREDTHVICVKKGCSKMA